MIYVAFNTSEIDCRWLPSATPVIVVHNDDRLDEVDVMHDKVTHLYPGSNIGFGAGVNLALPFVDTERVVLANPDITFGTQHWAALSGTARMVVTVPLIDRSGRATSVVTPYFTPLALAGFAFRVGARLLPLGSRRRRLVARVFPGWLRDQQSHVTRSTPYLAGNATTAAPATHGANHREAMTEALNESDPSASVTPLDETWVSGAVMSLDVERLRSVDGFDGRYFLYLEDVDLCWRLQRRYLDMVAVCADVDPAVHVVGASSAQLDRPQTVEAIRRRSAIRYGASQPGFAWLGFKLLDRVLSDPPKPDGRSTSVGSLSDGLVERDFAEGAVGSHRLEV